MADKQTQKTIQGTVVKLSSNQTIRVATKITKVHPIYRKRYSLLKHFVVHDQDNQAKVGDIVTITMCRPVSKNKRWTVLAK